MTFPIYQVDAFTNQPFAGNPAGVCLLKSPPTEQWMQSVAAEMNLSETAFLHPENDGYRLRWFTPRVEVALCGHATLGSAHTLYETGLLKSTETAHFYTKSGLLTATQKDSWISLNFPAKPLEVLPIPAELLQALGIRQALLVGKNQFDYLVEVEDESIVRNLTPDFAALLKFDARGVMVTSRSSNPEFDFVSRFFAPRVGVNEDPVTGSAHCCLTPYWGAKLGKTSLNAYQASARGGVLRVRLDGERVILSGQAITVIRGELA